MAGVTDVDRGYRKILEAIEQTGEAVITVGIHAEAGGENIENAERHEFGLGVPARPFVSGYADEQGARVVQRMRDAAAAGLRSGTVAQNLDAVAQVVAGEMQGRIAQGIPPPNAPSTIAKKGSSTPLIDTGQLRSSITGKLVTR